MSQLDAVGPGHAADVPLPRRDWILLPLLGLLTICVLVVCNQLMIWWLFPYSKSVGEDCLVKDPLAGARDIPNSVCKELVPEGGRSVYRFNSSGYRDDADFGAKSPGTYRIVLAGTSTAAGFRVPQERSMAALLPAELSRRTGRKVEIYNESLPGRSWRNISFLFSEFLAAQPDLVLLIVTPIDIWDSVPSVPTITSNVRPPTLSGGLLHRMKAAFAVDAFVASVSGALGNPHSSLLLRHLLYESPSLYVSASLLAGDDESGFLRRAPSAEWQTRLKEFATQTQEIENKAAAAGVPLVVAFVPNRTQAAMVSMGAWPAGFDPYKMGEGLRAVIKNPDATYIDLTPALRNILDPERAYFPVDVHPNAAGHAIFARLIAEHLTSGAVSGLTAARQSQTPSAKSN